MCRELPPLKPIPASFMPAANEVWEGRFPGIFHITDGTMDTSELTGPGLGAVSA